MKRNVDEKRTFALFHKLIDVRKWNKISSSSNFMIQVKVHDFNTLLVQETVQSVGNFATDGHTNQFGLFSPRESITAQHLLGMDWIRL